MIDTASPRQSCCTYELKDMRYKPLPGFARLDDVALGSSYSTVQSQQHLFSRSISMSTEYLNATRQFNMSLGIVFGVKNAVLTIWLASG